jgi:hypothetical protein
VQAFSRSYKINIRAADAGVIEVVEIRIPIEYQPVGSLESHDERAHKHSDASISSELPFFSFRGGRTGSFVLLYVDLLIDPNLAPVYLF